MIKKALQTIAIGSTAVLLLGLGTISANADNQSPGTKSVGSGISEEKGVPGFIYDALIANDKTFKTLNFNSYEWDETNKKLLIHYFDDGKALSKAASSALPANSFALVQDRYSVKALEEEAYRIATSGTTIGGLPVVSAGPNVQASGITVRVADGNGLTRFQALPPVGLSKFPASVEVGSAPEASSRQYDPNPPYWGGALFSRPVPNQPGYISTCSTGFGVGYMQNGSIPTELLTAEHCGPTGSVWTAGDYTVAPTVGTMQDTSAVGTDIKRVTGTSYGPVIFGGNENSNSGIGIKGAIPAILNDYWCYSGSQSGIICNNKVTSLNQTVVYPKDNKYYRNMVYTNQQDGTPASGNGDSGGPVITARNGNAYAVAIISGMFNASNNCSGKPATNTRQCSTSNIGAPVEAFFQDNPNYGILTYGG